jgi:hypothetical protein
MLKDNFFGQTVASVSKKERFPPEADSALLIPG